jgi:hypothetical protein
VPAVMLLIRALMIVSAASMKKYREHQNEDQAKSKDKGVKHSFPQGETLRAPASRA